MQQLSSEASKQLGEEAKESGELAGEAKPLDAEAAQDLGDAQQQAQQAAGNPAERPAKCRPPRTACARTSPRPRRNLAARQQQIAAEAAQAQAEGPGQPGGRAGARPRTGPRTGPDARSTVRRPHPRKGQEDGPRRTGVARGQRARRAGHPQGALVCQLAPRGPRHHAQQCPTPSSARIRTADPGIF